MSATWHEEQENRGALRWGASLALILALHGVALWRVAYLTAEPPPIQLAEPIMLELEAPADAGVPEPAAPGAARAGAPAGTAAAPAARAGPA
ncbi:hypothetical protein [Rhodovarius crocodyli]|uniref:hypothetical protein n=1 Tax=Rhodovarius crocodyli TaxID=1979269 RepID=UPI00197D55F3|nr:hypothetical protein [Rhodovarius crocodyli]